MTIEFSQIWVFTAAMAVLVLSPGPVVAAVIARALSRGFHAIWPIVLAVVVGDLFWAALVIFGLGNIAQEHPDIMRAVRWAGAAYLVYLGVEEFRHAHDPVEKADLGGRKRFWPVFVTGLVIILTNPKAIFFYLSFLPQFFDISRFALQDTLFVAFWAAGIAFIGNVTWGAFATGAAKLISSEKGRARLRQISGAMLIMVAVLLLLVK